MDESALGPVHEGFANHSTDFDFYSDLDEKVLKSTRSVIFFILFLIEFIVVTMLVRLYNFQVYNSMVYHI